jgi:hypothetical protein
MVWQPASHPLIVGIYFPAQLTLQLTFFLNGKDGVPGPNGTLLGTWGLLWAWAAWASLTATVGSTPPSSPAVGR